MATPPRVIYREVLDATTQELYEDKLISAVSSQFTTSTLAQLNVNIAFQRNRLNELYARQRMMEDELAQMKAELLTECEDILREQQFIEVK